MDEFAGAGIVGRPHRADRPPESATMTSITDDDAPDELASEQEYLVYARACLARMRDATERLKAQGGDPLADEALETWIVRRLRALQDDPDLPLFFGRIDLTPSAGGATFH